MFKDAFLQTKDDNYGRSDLALLPANEVRHLTFRAQQLQQKSALDHGTPPLIQLSLGEPTFATPQPIRAAVIALLQSDAIPYGPAVGWDWLRDLLATKVTMRNGYAVDLENTAVSIGGTGAIHAALTATIQAGDEVLVPDPTWPQYNLQLVCCGARAVPYTLDAEQNWLPDMEQLRQLITPRTRMLIMNSPANPTGTVFPASLVRELLAFTQEHNLYLLSDECYDELVFDLPHVSPASFLSPAEFERGRVICIYSFSKTYAMTGWRIGYAVANKSLIRTITHVLDSSYTNVSKVIQIAAKTALEMDQTIVADMRQAYRQRRDRAITLLLASGYPVHVPQGAFYLMLPINQSGSQYRSSQAFAHHLLEKYHTLVAPGSAFGNQSNDFIRISFASSLLDLEQGVRNIIACMQA